MLTQQKSIRVQRGLHVFGAAFVAFALLSLAAPAGYAASGGEAQTQDPVTQQLADLILASQRQVDSGHPRQALETLTRAQQIAFASKRPEAKLIEAHILRVQSTLDAAKQTPPAAKETLAPTPTALEQPAGPETQPAPRDNAKDEETAPVTGQDAGGAGLRLSLVECIEISLQNNLGLKVSRLADRASDLDLRVAWSRYLPEFALDAEHCGGRTAGEHSNTNAVSGSITQTSPWGTTLQFVTSESEAHPGVRGARKASSVGVSLSQPLWRGAGLDVGMHEIRSARLNRLISRGNLELDVQQMIFNVKSAYADCIGQLQTLEVNRRAVKSAEEFLRLTKARHRAGQETQLDVFNAEIQLGNRELTLTNNQRDLISAFDQLKQIMDVDLEEKIMVVEAPVDFGEAPDGGGAAQENRTIETNAGAGVVTLVTWQNEKPAGTPVVMFRATRYDEKVILAEALANRIELLNSRRYLAIQKLNALLTKDGLGHQIDLTAGYTRSGAGSTWSESHGLEDHDYSVGINLSLPWGKISDRAEYERALLELQRAEIERKQVRTQVHGEVRSIMRNLRATEKSILIQGKTVEQAKRSVEAAQVSFRAGLKDSFDVITAEDSLLEAKTNFITRSLNYTVLLAQLETVVGKASGRVDLEARSPGGLIDASLPDELKARGLPRIAPDADPRVEDDPFEYRKKSNRSGEETPKAEDAAKADPEE